MLAHFTSRRVRMAVIAGGLLGLTSLNWPVLTQMLLPMSQAQGQGQGQGQTANQAQGQAQPLSTTERLNRLERVVDSGTLLQLLESVETLRSEVRELRGEVELQTFQQSQLKSQQRELYLDVDRRLKNMEKSLANIPPGTSGVGTASRSTPETAGVDPGSSSPSTSSLPTPGEGVATTGVSPGASPSVAEQKAYEASFNLLKAGRYEDAILGFREFLESFPDGTYADNAQYWLGETFLVTRRLDVATGEFNKVLQRYPDSPKSNAAKLKIGYIQHEQGRRCEARATLEEVVKASPQSTEAKLARKRIAQIGGC